MGKTWVLKEFGKRYYENIAYFNFDENEDYKQFFETTKDVDRILQNLILASGQKLEMLPPCRRRYRALSGHMSVTLQSILTSTMAGGCPVGA